MCATGIDNVNEADRLGVLTVMLFGHQIASETYLPHLLTHPANEAERLGVLTVMLFGHQIASESTINALLHVDDLGSGK